MVNRTLVDFASVVAAKDYDLPVSAVAFGMLRKLDLPDLCASMAPRPVCLVNPVGPNGNALALSEVNEAYKIAKQSEKFSVRVEPDPADEIMLMWMQKACSQRETLIDQGSPELGKGLENRLLRPHPSAPPSRGNQRTPRVRLERRNRS